VVTTKVNFMTSDESVKTSKRTRTKNNRKPHREAVRGSAGVSSVVLRRCSFIAKCVKVSEKS
jgi:hypothetical protein